MTFINIFVLFLQEFSQIFSINNKIRKVIVIKLHAKREKIISLFKLNFINSILSAFIRIFNKIIFNWINSKEDFLIIKIGYQKLFEFYPFLNLDYYFRKIFAIEKLFNQIIDIKKINLSQESCEEINIRHIFDYIPKNFLEKTLQRWKDLLIPGGKLVISFDEKSIKKINYSLDNVLDILKILNFNDITTDFQDKIFEINCYKKIEVSERVYPKFLLNKRFLDILLNNNCVIIVNDKKDIILENLFSSSILRQINKRIELVDTYDLDSKNSLQYLENKVGINHIFLLNLLEYHYQSSYPEIFRKIIDNFGESCKIHLILPDKDIKNYGYLQFFNKGIIAKICDNNDLNIERIAKEKEKKVD